MGCAVCGDRTRKGQPPITAPQSLAGREACDWCGLRLDKLARGQLSKQDFDQLLVYVAKLEDAQLEAELQAMWDVPPVKAAAEALASAQEAGMIAAMAIATTMPVTSGHSFEGSRIEDYLGFVSSEVVLGMGFFRGIGADFADFFGTESQGLARKLMEAKKAVFTKLRQDVVAMGGNAIIGIDLDYTMFGSSLVGVIASGTAVTIERQD